MSINFTTDIVGGFYASQVSNNAAYQSPGTFNIPTAFDASTGIAIAIGGTNNAYVTVPTITISGGTSLVAATATARMGVVGVAINAVGASYNIADVISLSGGTGTAATFTVTKVSPITAQTQAVYNNTGSNGTFFGGAGGGGSYANGNTITLTDGSVVTVVANAGGVVTQFSIVSTASTGTVTNHATLTQASTNGTGTGFTLTLGTANQRLNRVTTTNIGLYSVLPAVTAAATTVAPAGGAGATLDTTYKVARTVIVQGQNYTVAPTAAPSGGNATFVVSLSGSVGQASPAEQRLLTLVEVMRAYIATCASPQEAKLASALVDRMLATLPHGTPSTFSTSTNATRAQAAAMRYFAGHNRNPNM